jgi:drug/metabolite transporter (DMT)-like permease
MNWILAGFLMFAFSVVQYLLVRKSVQLKTPSQFSNLAMFLIPSVLFYGISAASRINLHVGWYEFAVIVVLAVFFSYLGNVFSLKSIEVAPNPGYSLVLSKSYVVFTTLASIPLFRAALTVRSGIAIAMILVFSALISITGKAKQASHVRASWLPLAIGAFFCWGMLSLTSKYLLILGVHIYSRLIYSMVIVTVLIGIEMAVKKISFRHISFRQMAVSVLIGICSAGFNYFMQAGFATAPNIGYINAMNASSIGLVVLGSAVFFHDEFSLRKGIGVAGVIAGLVMLVV